MKIITISFLIISVCFSIRTTAQENLDSLKKICSANNYHDTIRITTCLDLANRLYHSDVDTGLYYTRKALNIIDIHDSKSISTEKKAHFRADGFLLFESIYLYQGIMDSAIFYGNKAIDIYSKYKLKKKLAQALIALGSIYDYQARNKDALYHYNKAQQLFEEINDTNGVALILNNLGVLYYGQGDSLTAINYFEKCILLYQKTGNYEALMWTVNNLGNIYLKKNNYKKALEMYKKALIIDDKIENKAGLAYTLKNLGNYYLKLKVLDSALYYHQQDLELYTKLKNESGIALANTNIGSVYYEAGNYKLAKQYGETAYSITSRLNLAIRTFEVAVLLKNVYRKTSDLKNALYFTDLWVQLKDSMHNIDSERASLRQRMQYEYNKKEAIADEQHKQELLLANEKEQKQKILTYSTAVGLGLVGIFLFFVFNRLQVTRKQKGIIEQQKQLVEEKHKEITDSINYAERIQSAILPSKKLVDKHLPDSFILYKPKDIVAGDFYWMEASPTPTLPKGEGDSPPSGELEEACILFAAADCTGHGVPGAMVSVVCNNGLNRSVREYGLTDPGEILNKTREIVISEFEKSEDDVKDGMDIALCSLKFKVLGSKLNEPKTAALLQYAGANNPLWIIRKNSTDIEEIKANKQPIGKFDNPEPYTTHNITLEKGDTIYIFSDGYVDQFGGEKNKKFKAANFKNLLLTIQNETIEKQKELIDQAFEEWKGSLEQIDDVCVIGVRI